MTARIAPAEPPFPDSIQSSLDGLMRGKPPLVLFTTLARDPRLFHKFFAGGLLDRGNLTLRQRELVIARTTALCGSEYEWGVHIALFASHAGFDEAQVISLASGQPLDACWSVGDRLLIELCDMLHAECTIDDELWRSLKSAFSDQGILELLLLAGFYRTVSYLTNALRLPAEPGSVSFPSPGRSRAGS
jgi:alkylhydroperoxidase family enzyme